MGCPWNYQIFLLPVNKTITAETYCEYIQEIYEKLKIQRPALVNRQGPILLHDNARPQTSRLTVMILNELGFENLQHPPYSPDLTPTYFHLFKDLDHFLSRKTFTNTPDLEHTINIFIDSQKSYFFRKGIYSLVDRWQKCTNVGGDYFD